MSTLWRPAYYNEIDPYCCQWLRNLMEAGLIPVGDVDERSITEVKADDLKGYGQCHFFAGIAGWPCALRMAGWPDGDAVWTGSCPCPSFSAAGKGQGFADPRHLWPEWARLIRECHPPVVIGEQSDKAIGHGWLDLVHSDLESAGYAVGSAVLGACSVGAPHRRQRLYFVADAGGERRQQERRGTSADEEEDGRTGRNGSEPDHNHIIAGSNPIIQLGHPESLGRDGRPDNQDGGRRERASGLAGKDGELGRPNRAGLPLCEREALLGEGRRQEGRATVQRGGPPCKLGDTTRGGEWSLNGQPGSGYGQKEPVGGSDISRGMALPDGRLSGDGELQRSGQHGLLEEDGGVGDVAESAGIGRERRGTGEASEQLGAVERPERLCDVGQVDNEGWPGPVNGFWRAADWIFCTDGKWRATRPGSQPLATGLSARVGRLRAYGNAVCVPLAAEFIKAWRETRP